MHNPPLLNPVCLTSDRQANETEITLTPLDKASMGNSAAAAGQAAKANGRAGCASKLPPPPGL